MEDRASLISGTTGTADVRNARRIGCSVGGTCRAGGLAMKNDATHAVSLALGILMDPQSKQQQKRRAAIVIQRVVFKANDGLMQAAEILASVAMGEVGPSIQREANAWLVGGEN